MSMVVGGPHSPRYFRAGGVRVTDLLLIAGPGGLLAFTADELRVASLRAREVWDGSSHLSAQTAPDVRAPVAPEALLDDRGMERLTGVAASWWAAAARRDAVPHHRIGRWVRFRPSEAIPAATRLHPRGVVGHAESRTAAPVSRGRKKGPCYRPLRSRRTGQAGGANTEGSGEQS